VIFFFGVRLLLDAFIGVGRRPTRKKKQRNKELGAFIGVGRRPTRKKSQVSIPVKKTFHFYK